MRAITLLVVIAVASTACGASSSPAAPSAQTAIDVRVGDLYNFKLGLPVPVPTVTGTLSGNFAASVWDGSQWVSLGNANAITVGLHLYTTFPRRSVHGEQHAPPGAYDRVKLTLQGVTANIASGSGFGGITLSSDAVYRLGGSDHSAELIVPVTRFLLGNDPSVIRVINIQLNSERWLTRNVAESGQVEDDALQASIFANTSLESR